MYKSVYRKKIQRKRSTQRDPLLNGQYTLRTPVDGQRIQSRPYLRGLRVNSPPKCSPPKIFHFICYHIEQKFCIFISPKTFCDAQKVLKWRLGEHTTLYNRLRRVHPPKSPPIDVLNLASLYRHFGTWEPHFSEPFRNFILHTVLDSAYLPSYQGWTKTAF